MKPLILLLSIIGISFFAQAQSGPILIAKTSEGGDAGNGAGTIIQYTGGATAISNTDVLTSGNPSNCSFTKGPDGKFYGVVNSGAPGTDILIAYDYTTNSYTTVATFDTYSGTNPQGGLLLVGDSAFFGLAFTGGANGGGTLYYYIIGSDSITKLVDLPAKAYPYGGLMMASDGNLYGVTYEDGAHASGTIFRYNIDSMSYTPVFDLPAYAHPFSRLVQVGDTLYGMNTNDSIHSTGNIFGYDISTATYSVLYNFPGTHTFSEGSFIQASDGLLYAVTADGGLYGTTLSTGGILFSYNPATGVVDTLHNFGQQNDGNYPFSDVYQASDGMLYGMANDGGANNLGTIFQYNINTHTYTQELSFTVNTGYYPGYGGFVEYTPASGPVIYRQPSSITVCADSAAIFTVGDSGAITGFQWQVSVDSGATFTNTPGGNDSVFSFTAAISGNGFQYRVILTGNGYSDTSAAATITIDSCTSAGITNVHDVPFSLYPNPASSSFTIEHNYTGTLTVNVINLLGEKLKVFNMTTNQNQFDISDLATGIYQVQIVDGEQILRVMKVVKE